MIDLLAAIPVDVAGAAAGLFDPALHVLAAAPSPGEAGGIVGAPAPRPGLVLAMVLILGVAAQWLAWRLKVPSILVLLLVGFLAGPVAKWFTGDLLGWSTPVFLNIEAVLPQNVLLAMVSLAVALILFEGGMSLNFAEIRGVRNAVLSLVTVGSLVTWIVSTLAAGLILGLPWSVATLLGAILVVTGPTVIGPLLRFVRPTGSVGKVLKWEGIVIDPIGALLAVLVYEAIAAGHGLDSAGTFWSFARGALLSSVVGMGVGLLAAGCFIFLVKRFWLSDQLQVPVALALLAAAFVISNSVVHEAGLFAATIMGITLGNQKQVRVAHIMEFKETLVVLLIALLFIVLSARLSLENLARIDPLRAAGFVLVLILIGRPLAVFASTLGALGGKSSLRDKLFMSWMGPRGVVAAAVASVFGLALQRQTPPVPGAELIAPYMFLTIVSTVAIYGLTATWVARRLDLANPVNPGFLIAGASPIARQIGKALQDEKVEVLLVDLNYGNIQAARLAGLPTLVANVLSPQVHERIDLTGIGRLLALTPNNEVNSLAVVQYGRHFGRSSVYQLSPQSLRQQEKARAKGDAATKKTEMHDELRGRVAFAGGPTYDTLEDLINAGALVRRTKLSRTFTFDDWSRTHGIHENRAIVLFVVNEDGAVQVVTPDKPAQPKPGQAIIALTTEGSTVPAGDRAGQEADADKPGEAPSPTGDIHNKPDSVRNGARDGARDGTRDRTPDNQSAPTPVPTG